MRSFSIFPDVNVLLALAVVPHPAYAAANDWYARSGLPEMLLCRASQLGFLRLLTTRAALGEETLTNAEAWQFYEEFRQALRIRYVQEPASCEKIFRERSNLSSASPKRWMDAYLSAFASEAALRLVTFDATLASYTPGSLLLRSA